MTLTVTLPVPPSLNHAYVNRKGGGKALNAEMRKWKMDAGLLLNNALQLSNFTLPPCRLVVLLEVWFKEDNKRDVDNVMKLSIDSVAVAVGFNDKIVVAPLALLRGIDKSNPRIVVTLLPVPHEAAGWQGVTAQIAESVKMIAGMEVASGNYSL